MRDLLTRFLNVYISFDMWFFRFWLFQVLFWLRDSFLLSLWALVVVLSSGALRRLLGENFFSSLWLACMRVRRKKSSALTGFWGKCLYCLLTFAFLLRSFRVSLSYFSCFASRIQCKLISNLASFCIFCLFAFIVSHFSFSGSEIRATCFRLFDIVWNESFLVIIA